VFNMEDSRTANPNASRSNSKNSLSVSSKPPASPFSQKF